jgi:PAS domain S-box-containing protein
LWHRLPSHFDTPLQIGQYAHTSWTVRDGYSPGLVFSIVQTPDGYLWLGGEYGLFRFDGLRFKPWRPPAGMKMPSNPYSLLVARNGTLWIGTFEGLASWDGTKLTEYPEIEKGFVTSLLEDRDGTIWAGVLANKGQLCEVRDGRAQCHVQDGAFGAFVWSLAEDASGVLWVGAESGLWRWKPGPPKRFETPGARVGDLITLDGQLLFGMRGAGLRRINDGKIAPYPLRSAANPAEELPDNDIKSNKLLRDRDGGIWIGTDGRGLIHVQDGKADAFSRADGLSGNTACSLFEDREGNIWFASERGLDRFRKVPVATTSVKQGLSSDATKSILASADGSIWVATNDGLTRWKDARTDIFRESSGLPDLGAQSLYQDFRGRLWVTTNRGLAWLDGDRFIKVEGLPSKEVSSITGDDAGNLWLSGNAGLARFHDGRFVENIPWSALGRRQQAKVIAADAGGVWLSFWLDGGVSYWKDGKITANYTSAQGLGAGHVSGLRLDHGAVWAATEEGGLSRIKDGRVSTLTMANGLPCNTIHWSIEDDHRSMWMYTACGLVRVERDELDAWIANPARKVRTKRWDAADGVALRAVSPAYFNPPVAKAADGKLWFVSGEAVQFVDPDHLPLNPVPPPVYIESIVADGKTYSAANEMRLPPRVRDVTIEFTALSLVDPDNVHFRYRLEGHDGEWQEATDRRQISYANLSPGKYRFHVKAANNSGVWNEKGAQLEFSIAAAIYQTIWFRLACAALIAGLIWSGFQHRVRRLRHEEKRLRDVIEGIPAMSFSVHPDGSVDLVNRRWLAYTGLSASTAASEDGWESVTHPDDLETHRNKWRAALASGEPFENEVRHRSAAGEFRWFLVQAVPLARQARKDLEMVRHADGHRGAQEGRPRAGAIGAARSAPGAHQPAEHARRTDRLAGARNQPAHRRRGRKRRRLPAMAGPRRAELQRAREAVLRIKDDGKRAADIISGLKAFYKKDASPQRALLDVNEVVREMLVLLHREAERYSVSMRTELARNLPAVRADRVQMQQVLMNLMVNAFESMGDSGGELTIRTKPGDNGLVVSVSDTGVGIPCRQSGADLQRVRHHESDGNRNGAGDQPHDRGVARWKLWAEANAGRGATFPLHASFGWHRGIVTRNHSGRAAQLPIHAPQAQQMVLHRARARKIKAGSPVRNS